MTGRPWQGDGAAPVGTAAAALAAAAAVATTTTTMGMAAERRRRKRVGGRGSGGSGGGCSSSDGGGAGGSHAGAKGSRGRGWARSHHDRGGDTMPWSSHSAIMAVRVGSILCAATNNSYSLHTFVKTLWPQFFSALSFLQERPLFIFFRELASHDRVLRGARNIGRRRLCSTGLTYGTTWDRAEVAAQLKMCRWRRVRRGGHR